MITRSHIHPRSTSFALAIACSLLSAAAYAAPPGRPAAPAGPSQPAKPKAADLFKAGEAKYEAADYEAALADFQAADTEAPSVEAARYIGLCEDKLGHYRAAASAYDRFLAHPPPKLAGEVGALVSRMREIEQMTGTVHIEAEPPGASVTVDGAAESHAAPYEAHLSPGKHLLHATAPDHVALEREVEVNFASKQDVAMHLAQAPAPPPPPPPPPPVPQVVVLAPPPPPPPPAVSRRTMAFVAGGVAVAGAGAATAFGILALHNKSLYDSHPTLSNSDHGNNDAAYADGGIALAVAAGVTSLVLFLTDESAPVSAEVPRPRPAALQASPFVTPHGGGAGAVFRF